MAGGGGFRRLFTVPFAAAQLPAFPDDFGDEGFLMLQAALMDDRVGGADGGNGLQDFLQAAFGVVVGRVDFEVFEEFAGLGQNDAADGHEIAVEIHRADERLEGIGERAGALAAAIGLLAAAHHQVAADAEALGEDVEAVAGDDAGADFGEVAFAEIGKLVEKILGEDELKDGVAEEFEALIIEMMALRFVPEAGVGERLREEQGVAEFVFEALFERVHAGRTRGLFTPSTGWQMPSLRRGETASGLRSGGWHSRSNKMSDAATLQSKNPWPKAVTIMVVVGIFGGSGLLVVRMLRDMPGATLDKGTELVKTLGGEAAKVALAFNEKTVREEFISHAAELAGTSRFQFATLKEGEIFQREETGSTAWGLIPLPKVVVEARAPVEYSYYLDFAGPWEFARTGQVLTVFPPAIAANPPALDVSALQFYTLEGSVWRNDGAVRERLKDTLTGALRKRAVTNAALVRETGRQRLAEFVEKWLAEKFSDGHDLRVKVVFPDERPLSPAEKSAR